MGRTEGLEDRQRSSEEAIRRPEASLGGGGRAAEASLGGGGRSEAAGGLRAARGTEASAGYQKVTLGEPDAIEEERALLRSVVAQAPFSFDPAIVNSETRRLKHSTAASTDTLACPPSSYSQPTCFCFVLPLTLTRSAPSPSRVRTPCRAHTCTCKRFTPSIHSFPGTNPVGCSLS